MQGSDGEGDKVSEQERQEMNEAMNEKGVSDRYRVVTRE